MIKKHQLKFANVTKVLCTFFEVLFMAHRFEAATSPTRGF